MGALEPWHWVVILVIVLVIFGAGRLGEVGGALGKGIREFKDASKDGDAPATTTAAAAAGAVGTTTTTTTVAPATTVAAENRCPSCATVNPPSQVFCGQCGTRLDRAA